MRKTVLLFMLVSLLVSSASDARQCPANASKASKTIWNWGELRTGQVKTGFHPCGRKMTCNGGKFEPLVHRSCHWD